MDEMQVERRSRPQIFFGSKGLRAGWGCLLFLLLIFFCEAAFKALVEHLLHGRPIPSELPPAFVLATDFVSVAGVIFLTFLMARVERKPFGAFGLKDRAGLRRFGGGLLFGFISISGLVSLLWALHLLVLDPAGLPAAAAVHYGLLWGLAFLGAAIFEELLLRGYLLWTLARGVGFWWGAGLLSLAFGLIHGNNPGETPVGLLSAVAVGLVFCLSIWYTGSLWWAIGFHAAWDWGESFFWGVSDSGQNVEGHFLNAYSAGSLWWSGGATGPEGSLLVFPVLVLVSLGIAAWWRGQPRFRTRELPRDAER
jgi:membrane protease YdiL (CAAX protease family)